MSVSAGFYAAPGSKCVEGLLADSADAYLEDGAAFAEECGKL